MTIQGANLLGVSEVRFDGVAGTSLFVTSGTTLTVRTPARTTAGQVSVSIYGPGGVTVLTNAYKYVTKLCTPTSLGQIRFVKDSTKLTDLAKQRLAQFATDIAGSGCESVNLSHFYVKKPATSVAKAFAELTSKRVTKVKNYLSTQLQSKGAGGVTISTQIKLVNQKTDFTTLDQFKINRVVKISTIAKP